jgi:hypothetical protein
LIEEETHEKETVKTRFFCDLASLISYDVRSYILFFRLHLDLVSYRIGKADRRKDGLSYPISLFTSYLSSLFGIIDYVRCGFYSSADYPYTASKGKDAFAGLVYAYGCTDACASFWRI